MVKLKFTTQKPLLISSGKDLSYNIEYIERNGLFCKLNLNKACNKYAENNLFDFSSSYSFKEFINRIEENKDLLKDTDFEYTLESSGEYLKHLRNEKAIGEKAVTEFVNSNGKFYVPGSSIKGTLATILGFEKIGIIDNIKQKFIIMDSDIIPNECFAIMRTCESHEKARPPINMICMKPDTEFEIIIRKMGEISVNQLKEAIVNYYEKQVNTAIKYARKFLPKKRSGNSGAEIFLALMYESKRSLMEDFEDDEYLINIGFGSGTYFKIFSNLDKIPTFKNDNTKRDEEAHTTFSFFDGEYADHIGWCKLTIEE